MPRTIKTLLTAAALASAVFAAGCGESKEEKALKSVCNARAEIQKSVNEITSYTAATVTLNGFKDNLSSIQNNLKTIQSAQKDLGPTPKQQISGAVQTFTAAVTSSLKQLGTSLSVSGLEENVAAAGVELEAAFQEALQPVDCSTVTS